MNIFMLNNKTTVEISIKIITYSYRNFKKKIIIKCKTCRNPVNDCILLIRIVLINNIWDIKFATTLLF